MTGLAVGDILVTTEKAFQPTVLRILNVDPPRDAYVAEFLFPPRRCGQTTVFYHLAYSEKFWRKLNGMERAMRRLCPIWLPRIECLVRTP